MAQLREQPVERLHDWINFYRCTRLRNRIQIARGTCQQRSAHALERLETTGDTDPGERDSHCCDQQRRNELRDDNLVYQAVALVQRFSYLNREPARCPQRDKAYRRASVDAVEERMRVELGYEQRRRKVIGTADYAPILIANLKDYAIELVVDERFQRHVR